MPIHVEQTNRRTVQVERRSARRHAPGMLPGLPFGGVAFLLANRPRTVVACRFANRCGDRPRPVARLKWAITFAAGPKGPVAAPWSVDQLLMFADRYGPGCAVTEDALQRPRG